MKTEHRVPSPPTPTEMAHSPLKRQILVKLYEIWSFCSKVLFKFKKIFKSFKSYKMVLK